MSYPELYRRVAFAAVLETTPGTVGSPTMALNAIRLLETPSCEEFYLAENLTDDIVTGKLGVLTLAAPGARAFRIKGRVPLIGTGVAYSASVLPEADPLLVAGGFTRAVTTTAGSEKVDYTPNDDPSGAANSTLTCILQKDGKQYGLSYGVLEEMTINIDAASFPILEFSIVGILTPPTEQALQAATYSSVTYPIWKGSTSLVISGVGAGSLHPKSYSLAMGLTVSPRVDANATDGHAGYRINGRVPEATVRAEVQTLANWDPRADWNARTLRTLTLVCGAANQYKRFKIAHDDLRVIDVNSVDEEKLCHYEVKYKVTMPASGNEIKLTFD